MLGTRAEGGGAQSPSTAVTLMHCMTVIHCVIINHVMLPPVSVVIN